MQTPDTSPLCTKIAARVIGLGYRTLEQWRYLGKGPAYFMVGRSVRYRRDELEAWLQNRRVEPEGWGVH